MLSGPAEEGIAQMDAHDRTRARGAPRAPVMSDVGRLAGVSHQTVSRVINGSPSVRPDTRRRVIVAMEELGYRPNSAARALATGRTNTLGVVGFDTTLYGPASTLFGIERAAHEAGYLMIVATLKALDEESVTKAVDRLRVQGVDGLLVIAPEQRVAAAL
jgi:DNA-binding LacI/PurR family transcriptional regulator